jgi:hypothetical protein
VQNDVRCDADGRSDRTRGRDDREEKNEKRVGYERVYCMLGGGEWSKGGEVRGGEGDHAPPLFIGM